MSALAQLSILEEEDFFVPPARPLPTSSLVRSLREEGQDHEFYPTTQEIIRAVVRDMKRIARDEYRAFSSLLDIGAGNGKVLEALAREHGIEKLYAIEKSEILCQQLDRKIFIVGTDFHEQSLLGKPADVTFCNPPYSEFEGWAEKIIRQSASKHVYLVIPVRWKSSTRLADAIRFRDADCRSIGEFSFEDSEDRRARAIVNVLRVDLHTREDDAFSRFFNEQFAQLKAKFEGTKKNPKAEDPAEKAKFGHLVPGPTYPEALVSLYQQEMAAIERNYQLVGELDVSLLKEFDIDPKRIMGCLKARLEGLKNTYWSELFGQLSAITDRLTSQSRRNILDTLHSHVHVDFTLSNIYAIVLWVIKNANEYINSQLLSTYALMVEKANVVLYKSNHKTWVEDRWRYNREEGDPNSHYSLDYRIVTHQVGGIKVCPYLKRAEGLEERGAHFIGDLLTIARNLGFDCETNPAVLHHSSLRSWSSGERFTFDYSRNGKSGLLLDVKAFQNGNIHLRLHKEFLLALNVEHGRLKGWLKSAEEAAAELDDPLAAQFFRTNVQIEPGRLACLGWKKEVKCFE